MSQYFTPIEKPIARKGYVCTSCYEPIKRGEQYYRWRSFIDGCAMTNKMHPECYEMHEADSEGMWWEYTEGAYERPDNSRTPQ